MKLLVVDDSPEVIEAVSVSFSLQWRDTEVIGAEDGESGLLAIEREQPDLVLLDIAMPGIDGFETLRRARAFSDVPVILLTARDTVVDKVKGLELGADDYVTKPFDHLELLARIKAVLRRLEMPQPVSRAPSFTLRDVTMDFASRHVWLRGELVPLTATEYKLLYHLVRNAGHVLPHATLLAKVWGREYREEVEYVRVYVRRLRRKLEDDLDAPYYILTERGIGYRFRSPRDPSPAAPDTSGRATATAVGSNNPRMAPVATLDHDEVEDQSNDSFPASDAPSWTDVKS
jgi:DNA-binding response OmpR family regulator